MFFTLVRTAGLIIAYLLFEINSLECQRISNHGKGYKIVVCDQLGSCERRQRINKELCTTLELPN